MINWKVPKMYKVKVYNEYQMREMLNSGKMQYENFYKDELISFLKFSVDENKQLKKVIDAITYEINHSKGLEFQIIDSIKDILNKGSDK